jgi:hypothetical protein
LAQPPDINETFLREVDENLRRDRARDFMRENGKWLVLAVILFLAAAAGIIYWKKHRQQRSEQQVEQLAQIYRDIGTGNVANAPKQLDELSNSGSKAVRASALFTRAAVALQQNDTKLATEKYRQIAEDDGLPRPYRDAAVIRQTALQFDQLKPEEVIARMEPLAKAGNPWFGSAGEMTALALIKQGKKAEAGRLFAAIAKDTSVPETIRSRSVQIAGSLGVDASDAIGTQRR